MMVLLDDPTTAMLLEISLLVKWSHIQHKLEEAPRTATQLVRWQAPTQGRIKINIDVGWSGSNSIRFGLIVRSFNTEPLLAATKFQTPILDPLAAEVMVLQCSLVMVRSVQMDSVVFKSDFELEATTMKSLNCPPEVAHAIHDCKLLN